VVIWSASITTNTTYYAYWTINSALQGKGTLLDPFIINNEADMALIADKLDAYYKLGASFSITGTWAPLGTDTAPFTGALDGNGETITFDPTSLDVGNEVPGIGV